CSVIASEVFARGELSTHFVQEFLAERPKNAADLSFALIAAAAAARNRVPGTTAPASHGDSRGSIRPQRSPWAALGDFELWRPASRCNILRGLTYKGASSSELSREPKS